MIQRTAREIQYIFRIGPNNLLAIMKKATILPFFFDFFAGTWLCKILVSLQDSRRESEAATNSDPDSDNMPELMPVMDANTANALR